MKLLQENSQQITLLCKKHQVKSLFAFGSVTTGKQNAESDVDLIIDISDQDPIGYSEKYFSIKFELEKLLQKRIDLLEDRAIKNQLFKAEIDRTKIRLYEA